MKIKNMRFNLALEMRDLIVMQWAWNSWMCMAANRVWN